MNTAPMPPRDERRPDHTAAKYLTELEELFVVMASHSETWEEGLDPRAFFCDSVRSFYRDASGDEERDAYFSALKQIPSGHFDEHGILNMLFIPIAYCAETLREFHQGNITRAWSLACDAGYWTGYVSVQYVRNMNEVDALKDWVSDRNRRAADVRHEENNAIAADIKKWFLENHRHYTSLDSAAEDAMKYHNASFRTARKHIGAVAREKGINLRSARKT